MAAGADLPQLVSAPVGARNQAGTDVFEAVPASGGHHAVIAGRPIGPWAFAAFAFASFGGPLALAALSAPGLIAGAGSSAGLATVAAAVVFAVPLGIWLRYSRDINTSGGLYGFVEAAAGRGVALAQAAVWTVSYALYLVYTTVQIVYDVLPAVVPGERHYQSLLALLIPVAMVGVLIAGRAVALLVIGLIAVGQLALAGVLDGVTLAHLSTPASSFGAGAPAGSLAKATAQSSLLYVCGSLPLFLGGELAGGGATLRRGLIAGYGAAAVLVVLAIAPLAAAPGLLGTDVPGLTVAQEFAGAGVAKAIGIGVAASIGGVMLCEYVALTRLVHAVGGWRLRPIAMAIGAGVLLAAPLTLIDPQGFYSALLKPSLAALWISQLIVFAVYPRFATRRGQPAVIAWSVGLFASGLAIYGLWTSLQTAAT